MNREEKNTGFPYTGQERVNRENTDRTWENRGLPAAHGNSSSDKERDGESTAKGKQRPARETKFREKEYYELLCRELENRAGEDVDISIRNVRKNNGIYKKACTVRFNDAQIAPTVYLEPYYDYYLQGEAVAESADNILHYCRRKTPKITFPENFFKDYGSVRERLGIKLIGIEQNEVYLQGVPHIDMEGLAGVFYYLLEDPSFGNGMIVIRNMDLERWRMTPEQLYEGALENCSRMLPPVFRTLSDVLDVLQPAGEGELYLLTNEAALYGAAVILYPGMLQEAADYIGSDFFVLPSSVHEVILLPDNGEEPGELLRIVTDINHTQVAAEEILIDAVYKYSSGDDFIHREA